MCVEQCVLCILSSADRAAARTVSSTNVKEIVPGNAKFRFNLTPEVAQTSVPGSK